MAWEQDRTEPIVSGVTATTTSSVLIGVNVKRTKLLIQNIDAANAVFIAPISSSVTLTTTGALGSVKLVAGGTMVQDDMRCNNGFNVIAAAGTANVTVWEW